MTPAPVCAVLDNPPDPEDEEDNAEDGGLPIQFITTSSESEDEIALSNNGYELLPQDPDVEHEDQIFTSVINELSAEENPSGLHLILSPQITEEAAQLPPENENALISDPPQHMETEQIEKVKAAMTSIKLPSSAIPEWAKIIPEEEWKAQLVANIKSRHATPRSDTADASKRDVANGQTFVANFKNVHQ